MAGSYTFAELSKRLHPRYLLTESPTDFTEAYWACQSGGAPNVDPETGFPYPEFPTKGTVFDPERHRRHANDTTCATRPSSRQGYETVEDNTKGDPWRPDHAERAHRDFTTALESIEQLEGVDEFMALGALKLSDKSDHTRLSYKERAEGKGDKALGFQRYLLHRYRASGGGMWRGGAGGSGGLCDSYRGIRAGTYNMLSRKVSPFRHLLETAYYVATIASLLYSLWFQLRGCALDMRVKAPWWKLFGVPPIDGVPPEAADAHTLMLLCLFGLKEVWPITYYLSWGLGIAVSTIFAVVASLLAALLIAPGLRLWELVWGQGAGYSAVSVARWIEGVRRDPFSGWLIRWVGQQAKVASLLSLNISSAYRIKELLFLLACSKRIKPSIRDADVKITSVSNLLFTVMLLSLQPLNFKNLVLSAAISLVQLYYQLVAEKVRDHDLADCMRDLNENRLSKFEVALLLYKIMDDVLIQDVQFNWTQHLVDDPEAGGDEIGHVRTEDWYQGDPEELKSY